MDQPAAPAAPPAAPKKPKKAAAPKKSAPAKVPRKKSGPAKSAKEHLSSLPHMGATMWNERGVKPVNHIDEFGEGKKSAQTSFRNHDYFTDREGEEDDDHPHFTGKDKVVAHVKNHVGADAKHYNISAHGEEKGYFSVNMSPKTSDQKWREKHGPKQGNLVTHASTGETYHVRKLYGDGRHIVTDVKRGNSTHVGVHIPIHELKGYEKFKGQNEKQDKKSQAAYDKRYKIKKSASNTLLRSRARNILKKIKR